MDTAINGEHATAPEHPRGFVGESTRTLDQDLRERLAAVDEEERRGDERFGSTRPILLEGAIWIAGGVLIWVLAILVWS